MLMDKDIAGTLKYIEQVNTYDGIKTALDETRSEAHANLQITDQPYIGLPQCPEHPNGTYENGPLDKYPKKRFSALPNYLIGSDWINPHINANQAADELYSFKVKHKGAVDVFIAYSEKNNFYVYTNDTVTPPHDDVIFSDPNRSKIRIPETILEKTTKPTSIPDWLNIKNGWEKVYDNPNWRGLEVNEEPDTGKTDYYTLFKKTFQSGQSINLGSAFNQEAYNSNSAYFDQAVANGSIVPYLVFVRPSIDIGTIASGTPPTLTITSPNSTKMIKPNRIYGTLNVNPDDIYVSVKEECTGKYLGDSKEFTTQKVFNHALLYNDSTGRTDWELDLTDVDFKRSQHNKRGTVNHGDRYMIDVVAVSDDFNVRGSVNFQMFYMEPPPECWHEVWNDYVPNQVEANINPPNVSNPKNIIRVSPKANNCKAINDAIKACSEAGGGRVVVPGGCYDTVYYVDGPIWLQDNVELHLEEGVKLVFGFSPEKYPNMLTRWGGFLIYNYSPLINAYRKKNVALTGKGMIDGNNNEHTWDTWYGYSASKDESVYNMMAMCDARVPLEGRRFGYGAGLGYEKLRPSMIQFYECENILIEDVQLQNTPLYNLDLVYCENVTVRGIKIHPYKLYNDDGIDVNSSNYVLIENCDIHTSDDAVVLKAGMNADAWGRKPSSNIIIRNNRLKCGYWAGAIAIGSDMSGGVFNIFAYNNHVEFAGSPIYLKASGIRGGEVSHIYIKNLKADSARDGIWFQTNYSSYGTSYGTYPPNFTHVFLDNVVVEHAIERSINIQGLPKLKINNIYFNDVVVKSSGELETLADTESVFTHNFCVPVVASTALNTDSLLKQLIGDWGVPGGNDSYTSET
jgi:hypothetical protein